MEVLNWSRYVCEKKLVKFIISEFVRVKGGGWIRGFILYSKKISGSITPSHEERGWRRWRELLEWEQGAVVFPVK